MVKDGIDLMSTPTFTPPQAQSELFVESVDHVARDLELKWGPGRLRLLVDETLRGRFDRQRVRFNYAVFKYDSREIEKHSKAMRRAWEALDQAAVAAGAVPLDPTVFEATMPDGTVLAICRDNAEAFVASKKFQAEGREVNVWSMEEVARMVAAMPSLVSVKRHFPGATVEAVRTPLPDSMIDEVPF